MSRSTYVATIALASAAILAGCSPDATEVAEGDPSKSATPVTTPAATSAATPPKATPVANTSTATTEERLAVAAGNNALGLDLLRVAAAEPNENAFLSPWSITNALAMTWAGARGDTEADMARALHFTLGQGRQHDAMHGSNAAVIASADKAIFTVANRLWADKSVTFKPEFLGTARQFYGAEPEAMDFASDFEGARKRINTWVEDNTAKKIRDLLAPGDVDADTKLVLTNAVYFKGLWKHAFQKESTQPRMFTTAAGAAKEVPMMSHSKDHGFVEMDGVKVLEMAYKDSNLSMVAILPAEGSSLASLESSLTSEKLGAMVAGLTEQDVAVVFPKFKLETRMQLGPALSTLGLGAAFSDQADFSGMTEDAALMISKVVHKAFVEVDEEGTEAAAATGVIMMPTSVRITAEFIADRPFLFLIRDRESGAVLFVGRVADPR